MHQPIMPPGGDEGIEDAVQEGSLLQKLQRLLVKHDGELFRLRSPFGDRDLYVVAQPEHAQHILVDRSRRYDKGPAIELVRMLLGNGLMTSEGELWTRQRRKVQRAFQRESLALLFPQIERSADAIKDQWVSAAAKGCPVDVTRGTSLLALDSIVRAIFGEEVERLTEEHGSNPFHLLVDDTARDLRFARKFRDLEPFIRARIQSRMARPEDSADTNLLGLIAARDQAAPPAMGERLMLDEIKTLIVAGHETTASTLNMTWYLLAAHPECAERIAREVASHEPLDAMGALDSLVYTKQVLYEVMRLYPPGWVLTRRAIQEDQLGRFHVPAGTDVVVCPYLIHRRPDLWRDPDKFDPDRFAPELERLRHRYAYLPFSNGPRRCVGERLAMAEMLLHVAKIVSRLRFEPRAFQEPELEAEVNLRMKHSLALCPVHK